ncbi:MAG: bifunctional metallophosphatase/5'-nucleotidase [Fimbriimonas sp.]
MPRLAFSFVCLAATAMATADRPITITVLHSNDLHSHAEPTAIRRVPFGGYARQATVIKQIRAREKNVLLLNAGDTFQGTLFFNVYEGLSDLAFMNAVGYDAMAVGNHEFDKGPGSLATFAGLAKFPLLSANLDLDAEPLLKGKISPSAVVTVGGERFGIVGCTTPDLPNISAPGPNVRMKELRVAVQAAVDDLTKRGINKIMVVSHCGFNEEKALVGQLKDVDLLVGGHSHSPLGTPTLEGWPKAHGPYPSMVKDAAGQEVAVVQAWEWGKVLGHLKMSFDAKGKVTKIEGAKPIVIEESIAEDVEVKALVTAFQRPILQLQNQEVGQAAVAIPREPVRGESLMANVIADAMFEATKPQGAVVAFINQGGVRGSLEAGKVTYGNAIGVQPFNNTLVVLDVTGAELKTALEQGVGTGGQLTPSRGSSYRIDRSKPKGEQVSAVVVAGQPLDPAKTYRVGLLGFTASGGDSLFALRDAKGTRTDTGLIDLDALIAYIKANSPLNPKAEGRVVSE